MEVGGGGRRGQRKYFLIGGVNVPLQPLKCNPVCVFFRSVKQAKLFFKLSCVVFKQRDERNLLWSGSVDCSLQRDTGGPGKRSEFHRTRGTSVLESMEVSQVHACVYVSICANNYMHEKSLLSYAEKDKAR